MNSFEHTLPKKICPFRRHYEIDLEWDYRFPPPIYQMKCTLRYFQAPSWYYFVDIFCLEASSLEELISKILKKVCEIKPGIAGASVRSFINEPLPRKE